MIERIPLDRDYILNCSFEVQLGRTTKISFSKVSNISAQREVEEHGDGGNTDRMYFFLKPKRSSDTIMFTKGLVAETQAGVLSCLFPGLKINDIMIFVKKDDVTQKSFYIEQGIISKISFSSLDSLSAEIIVKELELKHTGLVEVENN